MIGGRPMKLKTFLKILTILEHPEEIRDALTYSGSCRCFHKDINPPCMEHNIFLGLCAKAISYYLFGEENKDKTIQNWVREINKMFEEMSYDPPIRIRTNRKIGFYSLKRTSASILAELYLGLLIETHSKWNIEHRLISRPPYPWGVLLPPSNQSYSPPYLPSLEEIRSLVKELNLITKELQSIIYTITSNSDIIVEINNLDVTLPTCCSRNNMRSKITLKLTLKNNSVLEVKKIEFLYNPQTKKITREYSVRWYPKSNPNKNWIRVDNEDKKIRVSTFPHHLHIYGHERIYPWNFPDLNGVLYLIRKIMHFTQTTQKNTEEILEDKDLIKAILYNLGIRIDT